MYCCIKNTAFKENISIIFFVNTMFSCFSLVPIYIIAYCVPFFLIFFLFNKIHTLKNKYKKITFLRKV